MWLKELYQRYLGGPTTSPRTRPTAARPHGLRPTLEQLEERTLLSNYTAATVSDLIADINASNQNGGSNTITLVQGNTFSLTTFDDTTDGATELPVITANDSLTIVGNGDTIARSTASGTPTFRLFDVASGALVTLQNLALQGGLLVAPAQGGAVFNQGSLDLKGVVVQNNTVISVLQPGETAAEGGAIYSSGSLTLEDGTRLQNNQAIGWHGPNARLVDTRAGRSAARALMGGAAYGGGLYVAGGTVTLNNAIVSSNAADGGAGGSSNLGVGYGYYADGAAGGSAFGGGIYVAGGTVTGTSATLSANVAQGGQGGHGGRNGGDGGNGLGGGLYVAGGNVTLRNDTVTSNSAKDGLGGAGANGYPASHVGFGESGGLYIDSIAAVCLDAFTQSHVANNTASTSYPDIFGSWTVC